MIDESAMCPGERAAFANGFEAGREAREPAMPHLILHKVRGELAFDIATPMQIGSEDGWIIPTSGHRAYPMACWQLEDLADISDYPHERPAHAKVTADIEAWPDHYACNDRPAKPELGIVSTLLERLGLRQPLKRRF